MFEKGKHHSTELKEKNKEAIKNWAKENPLGSKKDCCKAVGITYTTLARLLKEIEKDK